MCNSKQAGQTSSDNPLLKTHLTVFWKLKCLIKNSFASENTGLSCDSLSMRLPSAKDKIY